METTIHVLQRAAAQKINAFFAADRRQALLVTGARQVGKTTLIRNLGREAFPHFVEINFLENPAARKLFENAADSSDLLLRMSSGLHSDSAGNRTDALYFGGVTVAEAATGWPLVHPPGTHFRYANNDSVLAVHALRAASGDEARALSRPFTDLFWPLGMTRTVAETDWRGGFVLSSQVWSTARDLARFGLLLQHGGMSEGRRLLPEGWVRAATTPSGPQPEGDFGYGVTLWLMQRSPGVPADTFAAMGNRGQYVIVTPSRGLVLVRRGEDPTGTRFDPAAFTAAILTALRAPGAAPR